MKKKIIRASKTVLQQLAKKEQRKEKTQRYKIEKLFRSGDELAIYTDGGYREIKLQDCTREVAGWGYAAVQRGDSNRHEEGHVVHQELGLVSIDPHHQEYEGANVRSNNTAEITAMIRALRWASTTDGERRVTIFYDSMYAAAAARGIERATSNTDLIVKLRVALATARRYRSVRFEHVKGHCGHKWNEYVDQLATDAMTAEAQI